MIAGSSGAPRAQAFLALTLALTACGSRSSMYLFDGAASQGGGGNGGGAGGAGGTTSSSGGGSAGCDALIVVEPVIAAPTPTLARSPEVGLLPPRNDVFLLFVEAQPQVPGLLRAGRIDAFSAWPPDLVGLADLDPDILDYVAGPGPFGPVALLRHGAGDVSFLATTLLPQIEGIQLSTGNAGVLFATGIPDRWLAAQASDAPSYDVLGVGSYQTGSLPQSEDPLICITSQVLGAGVPSGSGFLAAFVEPNPPEPACDVQAPRPGSIVSLMRYESPPEPGSFLQREQGQRLTANEPIAHLYLTPASFGAWVVFQTDGSTSRVQPAILAARVDTKAQPLTPDEFPIAVSPDGVTTGPVAVAAVGDGVAVAWAESLDPSGPTIVIRLVRPDGALGPAASIPTNNAWLSGRIRMQSSADGRSLLVAWDAGFDDAQIGLARVDCVGGFY